MYFNNMKVKHVTFKELWAGLNLIKPSFLLFETFERGSNNYLKCFIFMVSYIVDSLCCLVVYPYN